MFTQNTDWESFQAFMTKTLINGERAHGLLMRRKVNGVWEYRKPTRDEESEYVSMEGW